MEQKQIVVNGLLLKYYAVEASSESSKIIIFLHGWRSESNVWFSMMKKMSDHGFNCIALDLPGFGKSQTPTEIFDTNKYADVVVEFIKKLKIESPICVGHSYGGRILINIAKDNKLKLEQIVLVDASGVDIDKEKVSSFKLIAKIVKPLFKPKFMQGLRKKIYKMIGAEDYVVSQDSIFFSPTYMNIIKDDYTNELSKITIPTDLIWGDKDRDTPVEMAKIMHAKIKNSKLVVLAGGHYSFLDDSEEFEKVLLDLLGNRVH